MGRLLGSKLYLLLFTGATFLGQVTASSQTADGFVTRISSPSEFDLGTLHVKIANATICNSVVVPRLLIVPSGSYNGSAHVDYPRVKGLLRGSAEKRTSYRTGPIKCEAAALTIGSRVRIDSAAIRGGSSLVPDKVVIYKVVDNPPNGVALIEEAPHPTERIGGRTETLWLDGYPLLISPQTKIFSLPENTRLHYYASPNVAIDVSPSVTSAGKGLTQGPSPTLGVWIAYRSDSVLDSNHAATQLWTWPNGGAKEREFESKFTPLVSAPNYSINVPGKVVCDGNGDAAQLLPVESLQKWVSRLGRELVPKFQSRAEGGRGDGVHLRIYITSSIGTMNTGYFTSVDGVLPSFSPHIGESPEYARGDLLISPHGYAQGIFASPDGLILVPDTLLAKLENKAQLASLLSFVITSVLQEQGYRAWPEMMSPQAQRRIGVQGREFVNAFGLWQEEQQLRIGIREMYLAGYDIREAPFAWAVAQGKPVNNPVIDSKDPDKEIPWYAAYAFNYISQYYKDVDYSKLKRGDAEYAVFLQELRKADPGAFAASK